MSTAQIESKAGCSNPGCGTTGCGSKAMASTAMAHPAKSNTTQRALWEIKTEEQTYAFLNDKSHADTNRYGQQIDLIAHSNGSLPVGRSMFINENPAVGSNPNRNKQHGFFFTADNCIGCHACEAACSEKNDNPAHIAFRSVGYVEGGSFPDYKRMNISMACNHCDDPVCLKGCPTRAYTKHVEYGAVLQDPETCFGCGYCTWVCPYNAPQLDPVKGQVSKCNMCVDRLEVGLKPACVAACNGNALDFGVIENIPDGREQARVEIPGFPSPEITRPNIRFQQIKQLPDEMKRTDSMPLKYHKDAAGRYRPAIDQKKGKAKHWNLKRLSSKENPLVLFTLSAQTAAGAFGLAFLAAQAGLSGFKAFAQSSLYAPLAMLCLMLVAFGLFMSTMHLGKPKRFYRGFNNLRHSPVSREGLGIAIFMAALSGHILFSLPGNPLFQSLFSTVFGTDTSRFISADAAASVARVLGYLAVLGSAAGLYYMVKCYRIKARPFWNHWQVGAAFIGNLLSLGSLVAGTVMVATLAMAGESVLNVTLVCATLLCLGLLLEGLGHTAHARAMGSAEHEGGASYYVQTTTFGKTYVLRNTMLGLNLLLACGLLTSILAFNSVNLITLIGLAIVGATLIATSVIGRTLFYVLVIPTTMPGAFFWKNKAFEEHARDVGLANLPQVGVPPLRH